MTVHAVIDEQLGTILQRSFIADRTWPLVDMGGATAGKCHDRREEQGDKEFFHFCHPLT